MMEEVPCTRGRPIYREIKILVTEDLIKKTIKATFAFKPSLVSIEKHRGLNVALEAIVSALERIEEPVDVIEEGKVEETEWATSMCTRTKKRAPAESNEHVQ